MTPSADSPQYLQYKAQGNEYFKSKDYQRAIELYNLAIEACPDSEAKQRALIYGNRSMCKINNEQYGGAILDAKLALEDDPEYVKAFYRMGTANLALLHYKEALKNFRVVVKANNDRLARQRVKQCLKEIRRIQFEKAISRDEKKPSDSLDLANMLDPKDWDGHTLTYSPDAPITISRDFILDMMDHFKNQRTIPKKYAFMILMAALRTFKDEPSLYHLSIAPEEKITVCGDTHGQFYDLLEIFKQNGLPSEENPYLFNGDLVDRGSFSCEIALTLLAWRAHNPKLMHITRGNHETDLNRHYGFMGEVQHKYNDKMYELFQEVFSYLPLSVVVNRKVMVLHGGIGFEKDGVTLEQIAAIDRSAGENALMTDILWSDPSKMKGRHPSQRGVSRTFGPDVARDFMENNGLDLVIRSHEMKMHGYEIEPEVNVMTVFSAPNYCGSQGNKGAYIILRGNEDIGKKPEIKQFSAVPSPAGTKAMMYANPMMRF